MYCAFSHLCNKMATKINYALDQLDEDDLTGNNTLQHTKKSAVKNELEVYLLHKVYFKL